MPSAPPKAVTAVILAAGRGSRMKSRHPKAVHRILGKPLVAFPADACRAAGIARTLIVVPPGGAVQAVLGTGYEYVEQPEPNGIAGALARAMQSLEVVDGPILVLAANQPLIAAQSLSGLVERHAETGAPVLLAPEGARIAGAMGLPWVVDAAALRAALAQFSPAEEVEGEVSYLLTLAARGRAIEIVPLPAQERNWQVDDRITLTQIASILGRRITTEHLRNGVTIEDPANTYIEPGVTIGQDTIIRPQTFLSTGTVIGEECEIGPFVRISNCRLGDRVSIQSAVLADSEVGDDTRIGPFAQLRPGCKVGRKVKIGNFVELKNSTAEDGASMGHFAYLGDAFIGEKSNIGAGTITCNYDGKKKHRTHIGRHSFVGTHATLVAPVSVGDGAFVAAGSVITEEVPADALAIGRGRQVNKPDWAKQRRERE